MSDDDNSKNQDNIINKLMSGDIRYEDINKISQTKKTNLDQVKMNWRFLKEIEECDQDEEICLAAVGQNGEALQYVKKQTKEICLAALGNNPLALKYIKNQTDEICIEAVRRNWHALEYVKNQTEMICMEAINQHPVSFIHIRDKNDEICLAAIKKDPDTIKYILNQSEEICNIALEKSSKSFLYINLDFFTFNPLIIKNCYQKIFDGTNNFNVDLLELFYEKLSSALIRMDDSALIKAVDVDLKDFFAEEITEEVLNKYEELSNIKQKVEMLKLNLDKKNNNKIKKIL